MFLESATFRMLLSARPTGPSTTKRQEHVMNASIRRILGTLAAVGLSASLLVGGLASPASAGNLRDFLARRTPVERVELPALQCVSNPSISVNEATITAIDPAP